MRRQQVEVFRIACRGPGDVSGLAALIDGGRIAAADVVAVLGKTEGNGCVNDFTREYASVSVASLLGRHLGLTVAQVEARVALVMSGGTEGVLSPHLSVLTRRAADDAAPGDGGPRLALGIAFTRDFAPHEIGRRAQIDATADAVRHAAADAGIDDLANLHFVQIKCPLLTAAKVEASRAAGLATVTEDTYASMGWSRGASALGVALAMGEVADGSLHDGAVLRDWTLASSVASTSAGIELEGNVVVVMGMSAHAGGDLAIAHDVMADAIDAAAVQRALAALGLADRGDAAARIVGVYAKAEASPDGALRGMRHTMLNDSDIHATRHARAATGAVIASVVGHGMVYVSGGAEHQGPPGGGPVAVIARC